MLVQSLSGQEPVKNPTADPAKALNHSRKHRLFTEIGGRTVVFGSLNYEYALSKNFSLGAGFGMINYQTGSISRVVDGNPETGNYSE